MKTAKRNFNDSKPGRIRRNDRRAAIARKMGFVLDGMNSSAI